MRYRCLFGVALLMWATAGLAQALQPAQVSPDYALAVFANHSLSASRVPDSGIARAVIIVHGVRRNAGDYFATGERLLEAAHWPANDTLLVAPGFFTAQDSPSIAGLPLWDARWMQGSPSVKGQAGITPLRALDDLLNWLGDRKEYPGLKQIVLIGHSAGGQLVQRHAVLSSVGKRLAAQGITLRYVISSPSSYLYFDDRRPSAGGFSTQVLASCPEANRYRYGLEGLPGYLAAQPPDAQALFRRYASTPVTYLVGEQDNDPDQRLLDKSCAAQAQGKTRLERQRHYLAYESLLGSEWQAPLAHAQVEVPGAGHSARALYSSPAVVKVLEAGP